MKGRRLTLAIALVVLFEFMYLLVGNVFLNVQIVPEILSRNSDRFKIGWSSGLTYFPGHLRVNNLHAESRRPERKWSFSIIEGNFRLSPLRLFTGTIQVQNIKVFGLTLAVHSNSSENSVSRPKILRPHESISPTKSTETSEYKDRLSEKKSDTKKIFSTELSGTKKVLVFLIKNADISGVHKIEINKQSFNGDGRLLLNDLSLGSDGSLALKRGTLELESGIFMSGSQTIARSLQSDIEIRIDSFLPDNNDITSAAGFVSGRIGVSGDLSSFDVINRYLSDVGWLKLKGRGQLKANFLIERGRLMEDSELSIDSQDLAVELDERNDAGSGDQYRIRGTGRVRGEVRPSPDGGETRLQVELKNIAMHTQPQETLLLQGETFHLLLSSPPVNFSEKVAEPVVRMQWQEAEIPEIAVLKDFLPGEMPFTLISGRARLNGNLTYDDRVVSGMFELAGESISGTVLDQPVAGSIELELHLKQADITNRRLDLSGSRVAVQTAPSAANNQDFKPLQTELKIVECQLTSTLPLNELKNIPGKPPLSGVLKIEGRVADIDFLSGFLSDRKAIEFGGGGGLRVSLDVNEGRLVPGSSLTVESDTLVSSFSGFTVSGEGKVSVELQQSAGAEEVRLKMALRDMKLRKVTDRKLLLYGKKLQLLASSPPIDIRKQHHTAKFELEWQDSVVPDLEILNGYLPNELPFNLSSGTARTHGRLRFDGRRFSGTVHLAGEKVAGTLLKQSVHGKLALDLVIKQIEPETRSIDLSGTRILMQTGVAATENAPLETRITINEAKLKAGQVAKKAKAARRSIPFSGVVRLDGTVANIDFINSFLQGSQGLEFLGNGHLSADLLFLDGNVSQGSRLQIDSDNLVSRFLDFEANGSGMIVAMIEGEPDAPVGKLESFLKNFGLRRIGESVAYVRGHDFQITTVSRNLDVEQELHDLDTTVTLMHAEIPDISLYNTYLPEKAGIAILSGKGEMSGKFRLKGASGSGALEVRGQGVQVTVRDQKIKGDLLVSTRLTDGNLEEMTFDATGTRLRIENGSLLSESGTEAEEWWGQLDIRDGRMTWKRPLILNAVLDLQLRDSGLLVHLFAKQKSQWLNDLLTIKNVVGETTVSLDDDSVVLRGARITGDKFLVLADVALSGKNIRGGMYAKYGILGVAIELENDDHTLRILSPRLWYDNFSKKFKPYVKEIPAEPDRDRDDVADARNLCPDSPPGATVDNLGCQPGKGLVLKGVQFRSGTSELEPGARQKLDEVAASLADRPAVRVEVAGYTDSVGNPGQNQRLSVRRAQAVVDYLITRGVAREQLQAKGYGQENPIADNATAEGRSRNRRVELHPAK